MDGPGAHSSDSPKGPPTLAARRCDELAKLGVVNERGVNFSASSVQSISSALDRRRTEALTAGTGKGLPASRLSPDLLRGKVPESSSLQLRGFNESHS